MNEPPRTRPRALGHAFAAPLAALSLFFVACAEPAARPGKSNHETGLALDTSDFSAFRSALEAQGFRWFGSGDQVHFDYAGAGVRNLTGTDVRAFQRLWSLNNPGDTITVDGLYGPQTESRLRRSPASGFAKASTCG